MDVVDAMKVYSNGTWFAISDGSSAHQLVRYVVDRNGFDVYNDGRLLNYLDRVVVLETPAAINSKQQLAKPAVYSDISDTIRKKILASPEEFFPTIEGIYDTPYLSPSGKPITAHGYDASTKLYLRWQELMPPKATQAQSKEVFQRITDFSFVDDVDTIHALGLFLLPMVRPFIEGPTPYHLILAEAGTGGAGSGKTYFGECFNAFASHDKIPNIGFIDSAIENTLRLAGALARVPPRLVIWQDNIKTRSTLGGEELHRLLTSYDAPFATRQQGRTVQEVTVRCIWVGSGNNIDVDPEMARRVVPIRIKPDRNRKYMTEDLKGWIREHRGLICRVFLQWVEKWIASGRPRPQRRLVSFEQWSDVIGGILSVNLHADYRNGFLSPEQRPVSAQTRQEADFIEALHHQTRKVPTFSSGDAVNVYHAAELTFIPSIKGGKSDVTAMGCWLASTTSNGEVFTTGGGRFKLAVEKKKVENSKRYRVELVDDVDDATAEAAPAEAAHEEAAPAANDDLPPEKDVDWTDERE